MNSITTKKKRHIMKMEFNTQIDETNEKKSWCYHSLRNKFLKKILFHCIMM